MSTATTSAWPRPALLVAGLIVVLARPSHWFGVSLALTSIVLFLLSLGEFSAFAPAVLSQQLPLFSNFRIPSRYTIPFLQFAALTLAWAFQSREHRYPLTGTLRTAAWHRLHRASAAHLVVTNQWHFKQVFTEPPFETTFHWMAGPQRDRHRSTDERVLTGIADAARARRESRLLPLL